MPRDGALILSDVHGRRSQPSAALVQIADAGKRPRCTVETSSLEHGIPHCRRKSTLDTQTS
jgi:hypothetical protein